MNSESLQHQELVELQDPLDLNLPIILAGYTGSGKDTVSHAATQVAAAMDSRHNFHHSKSRYTDRLRRPSEIQGVDGYFVTPDEFEARKESGEFFYDYQKNAYGGIRYGFSWPTLKNEIESRHTFVVGGEIDTSIELKKSLDDIAMKSRQGIEHVLHPIILFVNRPKDKIIEGINMRGAAEDEKKKRIAHVEEHWERYPKILESAQGRAELIWNVDLDTSARQIIHVVESEVLHQLRHIFGTKAGRKK